VAGIAKVFSSGLRPPYRPGFMRALENSTTLPGDKEQQAAKDRVRPLSCGDMSLHQARRGTALEEPGLRYLHHGAIPDLKHKGPPGGR
jgi:hypothetical protein